MHTSFCPADPKYLTAALPPLPACPPDLLPNHALCTGEPPARTDLAAQDDSRGGAGGRAGGDERGAEGESEGAGEEGDGEEAGGEAAAGGEEGREEGGLVRRVVWRGGLGLWCLVSLVTSRL